MNNFTAWWAFCQEPQNDGQANDTADDGAGTTRWGWTLPTWQDARRRWGMSTNPTMFATMTQVQAGALALVGHWNRLLCNRLATGADVSLADWAWTSGGAVRQVQTRLGVGVDGIMGPLTAAAINAEGVKFPALCYGWRVAYYDSLGFRTKFPGLYTRAAGTLALTKSI